MKRGTMVLALLLAVMMGMAFDRFVLSSPDTSRPLVCRPSAPWLAATESGKATTLIWGNSLGFDTDWDLGPDRLVVNCAQQGLTAAAALEVLPQLPAIPFETVIVFLGSVELAREATVPEDFADTLTRIVHALGESYPDAEIVLAGVPHSDTGRWRYDVPGGAGPANDIIAAVPGATYFDTIGALSAPFAGPKTYDGVHLTRESYRQLSIHLRDRRYE